MIMYTNRPKNENKNCIILGTDSRTYYTYGARVYVRVYCITKTTLLKYITFTANGANLSRKVYKSL